jgi:hypothetical protein
LAFTLALYSDPKTERFTAVQADNMFDSIQMAVRLAVTAAFLFVTAAVLPRPENWLFLILEESDVTRQPILICVFVRQFKAKKPLKQAIF